MKSIKKDKFKATRIAIKLMHDWINEALRCGGMNSLRSDIYRTSIPEGKYSDQIASFVSELLSDQQSLLITASFPNFTSSERSNHFLGQLRSLSQERLETVLYSYLVYEIEINEIELRQLARKLTTIRNKKIKTEQDKVIFNQEELEYFRLKTKLEDATHLPVFAEITLDLYPKKPFSKKYTGFCSKVLKIIK